MNELSKKYKDKVEFVLVYILEAHPEDGWKVASNEKQGIQVNQPKTAEERQKVAETCCTKLEIKFPTVVDSMDNKTEKAYAAWPDRLYIVGKDGKIAYKGGMGPGGFKVNEMAAALEKMMEEKK